jgi:hypothetical protein
MEGKAVLFKRFADVDSIDLELDTEMSTSSSIACGLMGPTFGGINLEDIKAPECFIIEQRLRERWTFRSSTTTSTAPPSSRGGPDQRAASVGRRSKTTASSATGPARRHRLHRTGQGDGRAARELHRSATPRA